MSLALTLREVTAAAQIVVLVVLAIGIFMVITRYQSRKRDYFILSLIATFITLLGATFQITASTIDGGLIAWRIVYIGGMLIPPFSAMFVQKYCEHPLPKAVNIFMFTFALVIIILTTTAGRHGLIFSEAGTLTEPRHTHSVTLWYTNRAVLWPVVVIHPIICTLAAIWVLVRTICRTIKDKVKTKKLYIILFWITAPALSQVFQMLNIRFFGLPFTLIFSFIAFILVYFGVVRYDLLENDESILAQNWLRNMIAGISHDIKTPLTILGGSIEKLIEAAPGDPDYSRDIQIAYNKNLDLQRMIQNLIEVTRIEAAQNLYKPEWIPLDTLLMDIQKKYGDYLESTGLYLDISGDAQAAGGNTSIRTDPAKIWSVFDNIIYNAARHTTHGGVTITAQAESSGTIITITDTGQGIAKKHLPHVFDQFYKGGKDRGGKSGESGLGLFIVKSIMDGCGGRVEIESRENFGTSVVLVFIQK